MEKIKGLEKQIQTYIDKHPDCEVTVVIEKLFESDGLSYAQCGTKWTVLVNHEGVDV